MRGRKARGSGVTNARARPQLKGWSTLWRLVITDIHILPLSSSVPRGLRLLYGLPCPQMSHPPGLGDLLASNTSTPGLLDMIDSYSILDLLSSNSHTVHFFLVSDPIALELPRVVFSINAGRPRILSRVEMNT